MCLTEFKENELLNEINESLELSLFFKRLFTNADYQKLFFLHREQLFPSTGSNVVPLIFWHNIEGVEDPDSALSIIATVSEMEDISRQQTESLMTNLFPTKFGEYLMSAFIFWMMQLIKQNEQLKKLLEDPDLNLEKIRQVVVKLYSSSEKITVDNSVQKSIDSQLNEMFGKSIANMLTQVTSLSNIFPDPLITYHLAGYEHLNQLLTVADLTTDEYYRLLVDLYALKVVYVAHTVFWCHNCQDEHLVFKTKSNLSPHHMRVNCPRCRKRMAVSTVLELDPVIHDSIFSKDGLLGIAVAWFLQNNKLKVELQAYNEHEYDMICYTDKGNILVECKMHRIPDERLVRTWLQQDLKQLDVHLDTAKQKYNVSKAMLIYNFPISPYKSLIDEVRNQINKDLEVIDYTLVQSFVDSVKG